MNKPNHATICGLFCNECNYFGKECKGCNTIKGAPFWVSFMNTDICPLYTCCVNKKGVEHCGICDEFPCQTFMTMEFYDSNLTKEQATESIKKRKNNLIKRKQS